MDVGRAPKDHINIRIHQTWFLVSPLFWSLEPECKILMFLWSFGPLVGWFTLAFLLSFVLGSEVWRRWSLAFFSLGLEQNILLKDFKLRQRQSNKRFKNSQSISTDCRQQEVFSGVLGTDWFHHLAHACWTELVRLYCGNSSGEKVRATLQRCANWQAPKAWCPPLEDFVGTCELYRSLTSWWKTLCIQTYMSYGQHSLQKSLLAFVRIP